MSVEEPTIQPRGILRRSATERRFHLTLHAPAPDLADYIEHYWIGAWDLRGQEPYLSETLPHPSVHLTIERDRGCGRSRITGVVTGKFGYLLEGEGRVFGMKFRPGGFYPYLQQPVSTLTNRTAAFAEVFGADGEALEHAILSTEDKAQMIAYAEEFLRARRPQPDAMLANVQEIVARIVSDRAITSVDGLVTRCSYSKRTLQRLFNSYIGVSPKWVIMRYRLHEAAEQIASGAISDWSRLALTLGYSDQAHFIRDFKAIVGESPAEYARKIHTEQ